MGCWESTPGLFCYLAVRGSLVQVDSQQPIMQISLDLSVPWHLQGWQRLFRFLKPRCLISGGTWGKRQRPSRVPHPWVLHVDPNLAVFLKSTFSLGGDVLVSPGCCQRVPQTWWLRIPGIHCFQVLEASCVKSSCGQGWFSLAALRESQFQATIPASGGGPWCLLAGRHITPLSASMVTWPLHLTMSSILSLLRTAVIGSPVLSMMISS